MAVSVARISRTIYGVMSNSWRSCSLPSIARRAWARFAIGASSEAARTHLVGNRAGLHADAGSERVIAACLDWLCHAQDQSASRDGGVSRSFSLLTGWASSYPETTGYIVPTFFEASARLARPEYADRARKMLDWLVAIQLPEGAFQGGKIDSVPVRPVAFNTGQILLGLACGQAVTGGYLGPMQRAADWLVAIQDEDGCWRIGESPFAMAGEKTYDTHIAWALLEAARVSPNRGYEQAAFANLRWAVSKQLSNGWFAHCCLGDPKVPLTHTLGYALRGLVEGFRFSGEQWLLDAALRTANGVLSALRSDGFLPGKLSHDWTSSCSWACLTGTAQISYCLMKLYAETGDQRLWDAAVSANSFVRRTVLVDGPPESRGGVQGSFPIDGNYGKFEFLNWAAKFLVDSLWLETDLAAGPPARGSGTIG